MDVVAMPLRPYGPMASLALITQRGSKCSVTKKEGFFLWFESITLLV
jgi:hypothetical protein